MTTQYRLTVLVDCSVSNAHDDVLRNSLCRQVEERLREDGRGQHPIIQIERSTVLSATKRRVRRRAQ